MTVAGISGDGLRLLVCGGRDYRDAATVNRTLDRVLAERGMKRGNND